MEDEYRRSLAVREFNKKPDTDLRLDPVMLQRRMSDGSIADNQDYSRRILKVCVKMTLKLLPLARFTNIYDFRLQIQTACDKVINLSLGSSQCTR